MPYHRWYAALWPPLLIFVMGCTSTSSVYEAEDLVSVLHNTTTDYTLLVYRDAAGRERRVLRHGGVLELMVVELDEDHFVVKERGREAVRVEPVLVAVVHARIDALLNNEEAPATQTLPLADL